MDGHSPKAAAPAAPDHHRGQPSAAGAGLRGLAGVRRPILVVLTAATVTKLVQRGSCSGTDHSSAEVAK